MLERALLRRLISPIEHSAKVLCFLYNFSQGKMLLISKQKFPEINLTNSGQIHFSKVELSSIITDMIKRSISQHLISLLSMYPTVTITGPRHSGKTTLARMLLPEWNYVSLEDPEMREF